MSRMPPPIAALAMLLALASGAEAADLDRAYDPLDGAAPEVVPAPASQGRAVVVPAQDPDVLGDPALVVERPVGAVRLPPPPRVGGAFLYVPGLNGPSGPPAYPLLPFAFGYGY